MRINFDKLYSFLNKTSDKLNYRTLLADLNGLANDIVVQNDYKFKVNVSYLKHDSILMSGKVYTKDGRIEINLNRIKAISELKLDCFGKNFKNFIDSFAEKYEKGTFRKIDATKCLYFSVKNRPINFIYEVGSYKTLKYDLLLTIVHEIQHMVQCSYEIKDFNRENFSEDELYYSFLILFDELTKQNNISIDDNFYRPIELNARLTTAKTLNDYKKKNKIRDRYLTKIIFNSLPYRSVTTEEYVSKIKNDFDKMKKNSSHKPELLSLINRNWTTIQAKLSQDFNSVIKLAEYSRTL